MRRIVIMAMSEAGITCAKQIKKACPQDEVNILVSEAGLNTFPTSPHAAIQSAVLKRQGIPFPDTYALTALGLDIIATQQVQLDIGTQEIAIQTSKGALTIRYNELVLEVQASSRLPRPLHHKDNAFALPAESFGQDCLPLTEALAKAQKNALPALVVGSGMQAIDALFLAREAGLHTLWLDTPSDTTPTVDRHFTEYIIKQLQPHVVHIPSEKAGMESLEFTFEGDQVKSVTLPDGTEQPIGVCIWAETFLTMHPILREDGFILDSSGKMAFTDEKPADIHVIGSGATRPTATLCGGALSLPHYTGDSEAALASALEVANLLAQDDTTTTRLYGTTAATMASMEVYRTGISEEEATHLQVPVEHATLCFHAADLSASPVGGKAGRLSLNLIAHKEDKSIIGAQVIGENALAPLAHATLNSVFEAMKSEVSLSQLKGSPLLGTSGMLIHQCADRLLDKIASAAKETIYGITPYEFMASLNAGADFFVLDIRHNNEWRDGHIPLAHNIPVMDLKKRLSSEVPRYVPIVIVGKDGNDAFNVAVSLASRGARDLYVLDGGMELWTHPLEKEV